MRVRKELVVVLNEVVSLKRLSIAASIASFILFTTVVPSEARSNSTASNEAPTVFAQEIAGSARTVARSMGSVGYCFRGVKRALRKVGVSLEGSSAYMAKSQLADNERFARVSINDLRIGDILVHGASARHPHGHIAVYLGNGKEASDHIGRLITGARYGGTTVFRAVPETVIATAEVPASPAAPVEATVAAVDIQTATVPPVVTEEATIAEAVEAPAQSIDLSTHLSNALLNLVDIAQSAIADAVQVFSS